jgi:outer membrane putative beta-barrel porin/alpha-amylase
MRMNRVVRAPRLAWWLCAWSIGSAVGAQDLEPRAYTNAPIGLNFLIAGFTDSNGGVLFDPSVALDNAHIRTDGPVIGYARSVRVGDMSSKIDVGISHACLNGSADFQGQRVSGERCGLSDARVRWSVNFFGAPALSLKEFAGYRQNLVLGASLQLSVPTGAYDPSKLINVGTNRWSAKPEIGLSKVLGQRWSLDLAFAGTFYETNDDYYGGRTRAQDPIYSFQAHAVRLFPKGLWLAVDGTRYRGGRTVTDGFADQNLQSNGRMGLTIGLPINRHQSLKLYYSTGVLTRTGTDFDTVGGAWQYRWGGGF